MSREEAEAMQRALAGREPAAIYARRVEEGRQQFEADMRAHLARLQKGRDRFAADMRAKGIHVGMSQPARCVNCGELWPCPASRRSS